MLRKISGELKSTFAILVHRSESSFKLGLSRGHLLTFLPFVCFQDKVFDSIIFGDYDSMTLCHYFASLLVR